MLAYNTHCNIHMSGKYCSNHLQALEGFCSEVCTAVATSRAKAAINHELQVLVEGRICHTDFAGKSGNIESGRQMQTNALCKLSVLRHQMIARTTGLWSFSCLSSMAMHCTGGVKAIAVNTRCQLCKVGCTAYLQRLGSE